ncbi:MAG TPA: NAD(P)/FAD-dependent oxidoreductase [Candidatus Dormibacteraeota bacterium]|nr:NAD(P)/FAD-dependent oxidoreductase [Candidatus Dormibacteraeota bacterium]
MKTDVVVIGAGAAGLAAARELGACGKRTLLLEARERAGGRMYGVRDPRSPVPLELGAEFVHGAPSQTLRLLREMGTTRCDVPESRAEVRNSEIVTNVNIEAQLEALLECVPRLDGDMSVEAFLQDFGTRPEFVEASRRMRLMVEGFDASDPAVASVQAIAQEWAGDAGAGSAESRPVGGYGPVVEHLVRSLDAGFVESLFGAVVESIAWKRGAVRVCATHEEEKIEVEARAAVVTLPLGVLQLQGESAVRLDPELPAVRRCAIDALAMGPVLKAVMVCSEPVWESVHDDALCDVAFMHGEDAPFPALWTSLPMRSSTLVAWAGGPHAAALGSASNEELYACVLESVRRILGQSARDAVQTIYVHDWQRDRFARGGYSYVKVGGMGAREQLAAPLDETLFFAGEATALRGEAGTVGGALESGVRAAREVCAALKEAR